MTNEQIIAELENALPESSTGFSAIPPEVVDAIISRLRAPAAVPEGWQPIETAPKDAAGMVLTDGIAVTYGGWVSDVDHGAEWEGQLGCASWWTVDGPNKFAPTHWMPLPAAPGSAPSGVSAPAAGVPSLPDFANSRRLQWLCEDHADANTRAVRDDILARMPVMSQSAAYQAIDYAMMGEYHLPAAAPAANAQPDELPDVLAKIDKAQQTVSDLCHGRIKWTMRVPAEPDRDPDLVIAGALRAARAALAHAQSDAKPEPKLCDYGNVDDFKEAHDDWQEQQRNAEVGAMIYNGNTVSYMYSKARNYGNVLVECCRLIGGEGHLRDRIKALLEAQSDSAGDADGYYLASFKRGNKGIVTWWGPNNAGYTPYLNQAGIYRKDQLQAGYHDSEYTVPVPVAFARQFEQRLVDSGMSVCEQIFWNAENLRAAIAASAATKGEQQ